jgi:predicted Holliday junction resolvase-like endonuclease
MDAQLLKFFTYQRSIFGICPCCGELLRLSDCKIFRKENPAADWKEKLDRATIRLNNLEAKLEAKMQELRNQARDQGRKEAARKVKKIDTVFAPLKLNPDDSKVIFDPVDFVVFNGMKANQSGISNLILLDNDTKSPEAKRVQESVMNTVAKGNVDWMTLRVEDNGAIVEE